MEPTQGSFALDGPFDEEAGSGSMILLVLLVIAILTVPLMGGDIRGLGRLRFRRAWLLAAALGTQVWLIARPGPQTVVLTAIELSAFPLGLAFLVANRHIRGLGVIGLGAGMNFAAIAANGGIMPALPQAVRLAGLPLDGGGVYANSASLAHPSLQLLGDIFALPAPLPLANAFSIGDVVIVIGAGVVAHCVSGSRALAPQGNGSTWMPRAGRVGHLWGLWGAGLLAGLGAWAYSVFAGAALFERLGSDGAARGIVTLLIGQLAAAVLAGATLAGPLSDRIPPGNLIAATHAARAVAVASLALWMSPSETHLLMVAVTLGASGAVERPVLWRAMRDRVPSEHLVTANALMNTGFQLSIVLGSWVGASLSSGVSPQMFFAGYAVALGGSGLLAWGMRISRPEPNELRSLSASVREHWSWAGSGGALRTLLLTGALGLLGLAWSGPIAPLFVRAELLGGEGSLGPGSLGLMAGCLGIGMILGSLAGPSIARRWASGSVLAWGLTTMGLTLLLVSLGFDLSAVLLACLVGGFAASLVVLSVEVIALGSAQARTAESAVTAISTACDLSILAGAVLLWTLHSLVSSAGLAAAGLCMLLAATLVVGRRAPETARRPFRA